MHTEKLIFKKGRGIDEYSSWWTVCFNNETQQYTAEINFQGPLSGNYYLYEITKEIYDKVGTFENDDFKTEDLIKTGRILFEDHNNVNSMSYHVVHDVNFQKLCSWADIQISQEDVPTWID
ncbi:MAG: hypothetical protein MJ211_07380 [Bacteroidales bacterium]|nr:hypothetical protein [Bacteroidales bacterium]